MPIHNQLAVLLNQHSKIVQTLPEWLEVLFPDMVQTSVGVCIAFHRVQLQSHVVLGGYHNFSMTKFKWVLDGYHIFSMTNFKWVLGGYHI
jgi:hypothetical protein